MLLRVELQLEMEEKVLASLLLVLAPLRLLARGLAREAKARARERIVLGSLVACPSATSHSQTGPTLLAWLLHWKR